jgi:Family of unknown function (DUF6502)
MATPKETVLATCRHLLSPIVGILLRNGITYKELVILSKQLYVQVAAKEFGIRGRDTNLSRIAILTGINRKEAARIKEELKNNDDPDPAQQNQDRMTRVLIGWHRDLDFIDETGKPLIISFDGEAPSFTLLARRYGGDIPATTLLKELKRAQAVLVNDTGKLQAVKCHYAPSQTDPSAILRAGNVINDLSNTIYHNLYRIDKGDEFPLRFERRSSNSQMSSADTQLFRAFVEKEGQLFLKKIDAWLAEHQCQTHRSSHTITITNSQPMRLGVGVYLIENKLPEAPP